MVNACVKTFKWTSTHSAPEIAAKMPADYSQSDKALYAQSIESTLPMCTKDGMMPVNGPETVAKVLKAFNPTIQNADVDLSKTYTTEFAEQAAKSAG